MLLPNFAFNVIYTGNKKIIIKIIIVDYIQLHLVCQIQKVYFSTFVFSFTLVIIRVVHLIEQVLFDDFESMLLQKLANLTIELNLSKTILE